MSEFSLRSSGYENDRFHRIGVVPYCPGNLTYILIPADPGFAFVLQSPGGYYTSIYAITAIFHDCDATHTSYISVLDTDNISVYHLLCSDTSPVTQFLQAQFDHPLVLSGGMSIASYNASPALTSKISVFYSQDAYN
jgi:hypothetical protein